MANAKDTPESPVVKAELAKALDITRRRSTAKQAKTADPHPEDTEPALAKSGELASMERELPAELRFLPPVLCQVGLPRKEVKAREFSRKSGEAWLQVQAGYLDILGAGQVEQPVPYGPLPRLALAWMSTKAVREKTMEVSLGDSAAEFLRSLGYARAGNRYQAMEKQMRALAACRIQAGFRGKTYNATPVQTFSDWQELRGTQTQRPLWDGRIQLSADYFQALMDSPVPLDNHGLIVLKGTALGLDIYAWLAQRLFRVSAPFDVSWEALHGQFGQEYKNLKDFRAEFVDVMVKVTQAYPQLKAEKVTNGYRFFPSPPPIKVRGA